MAKDRKKKKQSPSKDAPAAGGSSARRTLWLPISAIAAACLSVYFNALSNGFVYDDRFQVVENQWIKHIRYIPEIFSKSVWSFQKEALVSNYYRPLMHIIYMLDYQVFGLRPWGFHFVNILFHTGVSVLVFLIVRKLLGESRPSAAHPDVLPPLAAALFFAVNPIHTESVTWVAGVPDVSFSFFYLLSFYLYMRYRAGHKRGYILSLVSFFAAALCKETALTLPIIIALYDHGFRKSGGSYVGSLKRYAPFLGVAGVYFLMRLHALRGLAPIASYGDLTGYQDFINVFPLFGQYLDMLVLPVRLNLWHTFHPIRSLFEARGLLSLAVTSAFFFVAAVSFRRNRPVFFGLMLIVVPLLPVFYIPAIGGKPFAERYLYLPSLGLAMLFALCLAWAREGNRRPATALTVAASVLTAVFAVGTINRNTVWKDNYSLFSDTVNKAPRIAILRISLGNAMAAGGRIDDAMEQYRIALTLDPGGSDAYAKAHLNLGAAYGKKGMIDSAVKELRIARALDPRDPEIYNNLGIAYALMGRLNDAMDSFLAAVRLNPYYVKAHNNLGTSYMQKGSVDKAVEEYRTALSINPEDAEAHDKLGNAYRISGLPGDAVRELRTAVALDPSSQSYRSDLSRAIEAGGAAQRGQRKTGRGGAERE